VDAFRRKWLPAPSDGESLGSAVLQSLNDLGGSLERIGATRLVPFGLRAVINVVAGALIPMVPLVIATTPVAELANHFGKMLFGVGP
jgi:hypothetical protein